MSKRYAFILIVFIITFLWPLFNNDFNAESERLNQMALCFKDWQIPCRWIPYSSLGYGSPLFNFLPPLPFYFGYLIFILTNNLDLSTSLMYAINFSVSLLLLWTFMSLTKNVNVSNMLLLGILLSLLLTSNNLLSMIFMMSLFFLLLFYYLNIRGSKKIFAYSSYSVLIGISLSSFYLIPSVLEKNLVNVVKINGKATEYLPTFAQEFPKERAQERFQLLTGESNIFDFKQGSNNFSFKTNTKTHTIIRISQHYFPSWKIFIDGKETNIEYKNNSLGLMTIILGEGEHTINGRLYDTPVRVISNVISLSTSFFILILFLYQQNWVKKWLDYYKKGIGH